MRKWQKKGSQILRNFYLLRVLEGCVCAKGGKGPGWDFVPGTATMKVNCEIDIMEVENHAAGNEVR